MDVNVFKAKFHMGPPPLTQKVQMPRIGPYLIDLHDFKDRGKALNFFPSEKIKSVPQTPE